MGGNGFPEGPVAHPMDFRALERSAWNSPTVAASYNELFTHATESVIDPLLQSARVGPGVDLLDVACGPGTVSARARALGARPVAFDFSRPMLSLAARRNSHLDVVVGSALALPFEVAAFDAVVCNFGLLHFPSPERALVEAARVLRPGGFTAWSVWGLDCDLLGLFPASLAALGLKPDLPPGPGFFRFAEPNAFPTALEEAGLVAERERSVRWTVRLRDGAELWRMFREGTARTRASILALSEPDRQQLRGEIDRRIGRYVVPGGLEIPATAVIGAARKAA